MDYSTTPSEAKVTTPRANKGPRADLTARQGDIAVANRCSGTKSSRAVKKPSKLSDAIEAIWLPKFFRKADPVTLDTQPTDPDESCSHKKENIELKAKCILLEKQLLDAQRSESRLKVRLAQVPSSRLDQNQPEERAGNEAEAAGRTAYRGSPRTNNATASSTNGDSRRLSGALQGPASSLTYGIGRLDVISAAAISSQHLQDASGLAREHYTWDTVRISDVIKAPFAALALDRSPTCDPRYNSKFVQAEGFCLQACFRLGVVVAKYPDSLKVIAIESSGGRGPASHACDTEQCFF